jgi:serine phosphatase RsbU (regulator of sigma subunit)/transcriptional regulator with GAF, ATPase, and Fis domain
VTPADRHVNFGPLIPRQPRLVKRTAWLRRHAVFVTVVVWTSVAVVFALDVTVQPVVMSGFYLLPLTLLALAGRVRTAALAGGLCLVATLCVMLYQGTLTTGNGFNILFGVTAGAALIVMAYLIRRLTTISEFAILRAQLSEAGADILASDRGRDDMDEYLEYSLERLGEQLDATGGVLLLHEDGVWHGRAGFGLGVDARNIVAAQHDMYLPDQAIRSDEVLVRDLSEGDVRSLGPVAQHLRLERVLVVPMRALERQMGVLVYDRPRASGDFSSEQIALAKNMGRYLAVALDNRRLMVELDTRRRDLELVRDSSLDFAGSLNREELLRAVVERLVRALRMDICDVYEVDQDAGCLRLLVSYEDGAFDAGEWVGHEVSLGDYASSSLAVTSLRPVFITSPDDPRLSEAERDEYIARDCKMQLAIPLRIRDRVIALVELADVHLVRELSGDEVELARSICQFAALAVDKAQLFDQLRASAERLDRLAQRLQRLQSFAVELNRRLGMAQPQEVMDEVARAAVDLLDGRSAGGLSGAGETVACRVLQVAGSMGPAAEASIEAALLQRCRAALELSSDDAPVLLGRVSRVGGLLLAPLKSESPQLSGTLVVADKNGRGFNEEDEVLIATPAAQASVSLHNTIAFQREHAIAETFQRALLMDPPALPGIDVGVQYRAASEAARVGGDFYALVVLGPGRMLAIVGDVCGKSLSAAAESAVVRYMLRAYAAEGSPGEALGRLNSAVIDQLPGEPFVTLVAAYVDVNRHMFEYAAAGHPRPVVLAGRNEFPLSTDGHLPVGIYRGNVYPTNRAVLPDDSCIVLYTDGVTDARADGAVFGEQRLRELIARNVHLPAQDIADTLLDAVIEYAGGVLPDDCAIVAIKLP